MRNSLGIIGCVVITAFIAGCSSTSQGMPSLPGAAPAAPSNQGLGRHLGSRDLLRLQAEGKLPGPMPRAILQRQLKELTRRPDLRFNVRPDVAGVKIWASVPNYNALFGLAKRGTTVKVGINTDAAGCDSPVSIKIDHAQNIWAGCESNPLMPGLGVVREWTSPTGSTGYLIQCPFGYPQYCSSASGYGFDSAENSTYVVASLATYDFDDCLGTICTDYSGSGFMYWPAGNPEAPPGIVQLTCPKICNVYYIDMDNSNDIWFDYYGCQTSICGYGLAEITSTSSCAFCGLQLIEPPGTYGFAGGVYVSNGGTVLNVIDETGRVVDQYHLPVAVNATPFNISGPIGFGVGLPVSGAFDSTDTKMVVGDALDWLDRGNIVTDTWKVSRAPTFTSGLGGAAYTPSDKSQ